MIGIRKALDMVFTRRELKILDDLMPEIKKSPGADDSNDGEAEMGYLSKLKRCCLGESPASKNPKVIKNSNEKEYEAASSLLK